MLLLRIKMSEYLLNIYLMSIHILIYTLIYTLFTVYFLYSYLPLMMNKDSQRK